MSDKKTYVYKFKCFNCDGINQWKIPFGVKVERFLREIKVPLCPHCDCYALPIPPPIW